MLPHQQRVVDEKTELDDKLGKLNAFILTNPHFAQLQNEEKERLQRQFSIMRDYTSVLGERIDAFAQQYLTIELTGNNPVDIES